MIPNNSISYEDSQIILSKSKTVKCLALIDIIFAFLNLILSPFFAISALITLIFATCGYHGSKNLNKNQVLWYLFYVVIQDIFRVVVFITYLVNPSFFGLDEINVTTVFFNSIFILCYFYITYFIVKFYQQLNLYTQEELNSMNRGPEIVVVHGSLV